MRLLNGRTAARYGLRDNPSRSHCGALTRIEAAKVHSTGKSHSGNRYGALKESD
jgi:hypothetical protein